ncbi:MAG TPA: hypothetical protein VFU21_14400, partial [Kofleriaceae bacterium]|nr:hypothetical protein [Kofleriaceae bacterium]
MNLFKTCALVLLVAGCASEEDAGVWSDPASDGEAILPGPTVWRVAPEELDRQADARQREVDRYIADELYRGYAIVETTQTHAGDLVDWVDPDSVPGSQIEPPPPIAAAELATPPGVSLQRTELDEHPELRGPEGTIPFTRPRFADYVRGQSGHASLTDYLAARPGGQPAGWNRLYAG